MNQQSADLILRKRAAALAQEFNKETNVESVHVVEFMLSNERYGIDARSVREVHVFKELTPLPGAPDFILGIINVRGQVISVTDLKSILSLPEVEPTEHSKVIILANSQMEFGILADAVLGARSLPTSDIQPLPAIGSSKQNYFVGVSNEPTMILNANELLNDPALLVQQENEQEEGIRA